MSKATGKGAFRSSLQCPKGHSRSFTCYGLLYGCHDCRGNDGMDRKFYFIKGKPTWTEPLKREEHTWPR